MLNWLVYYFIFVAIVAAIVAALLFRLKIKHPIRLLILLFILIVSPVVISFFIAVYFNPLPEIMVPDLIGRDLVEAKELVQMLDLNIKVESRAGESDIVSYQRPEEGRIVKVGRTVYVTLGNKIPQTETAVTTFEGEVEVFQEDDQLY